MSLFFVTALADPAQQYFLTHCSSSMPFTEIVYIMRRQFSSESRELQIQSAVDSLDLTVYMQYNDIKNARIGLTRIIDRINSLAPQLPLDSATMHSRPGIWDAQLWGKTRHKPQSLSFVQFITALEESLQISVESSRALAQSTLFGQYRTDARSIRRLIRVQEAVPLSVHTRTSIETTVQEALAPTGQMSIEEHQDPTTIELTSTTEIREFSGVVILLIICFESENVRRRLILSKHIWYWSTMVRQNKYTSWQRSS